MADGKQKKCLVSASIVGHPYQRTEILCNFQEPLHVLLDNPASMTVLKASILDSFFQPKISKSDPRKEDMFMSSSVEVDSDVDIDESGDLEAECELCGSNDMFVKVSMSMPTPSGLSGGVIVDAGFLNEDDEKKESTSMITITKSAPEDRIEEMGKSFLEHQLINADKHIEKLKKELSLKKDTIDENEKRITSMSEALTDLKSHNQRLKDSNQQLNRTKDSQSKKMSDMQNQIDSLELQLAGSATISEELTKVKKDLESESAELSAKNERINTLQSSLANEQSKKEQLEHSLDLCTTKLTEEKSSHDQTKKSLQELQAQLQSVSEELTKVKNDLESQSAELLAKNERINTLQSTLTNEQTEKVRFQRNLDLCNKKLTEEKSSHDRTKKAMQELQAELQRVVQAAHAESTAKNAVKNDMDSMRVEFDRERNELKQRITVLEKKSTMDIELIRSDAKKAYEDCELAVAQIGKLKLHIQNMEKQHQSEKEEWELKTNELRSNLVALQDQAEESAAIYQSMQSEMLTSKQKYIKIDCEKDDETSRLNEENAKLRSKCARSDVSASMMDDWSVIIEPEESPIKKTPDPKILSDSDSFEEASLAEMSSVITQKPTVKEEKEVEFPEREDELTSSISKSKPEPPSHPPPKKPKKSGGRVSALAGMFANVSLMGSKAPPKKKQSGDGGDSVAPKELPERPRVPLGRRHRSRQRLILND